MPKLRLQFEFSRMNMKGKLIYRYVLSAIFPYLLMALTILTTILLIQQGTKFTEIMGGMRAPWSLAVEVIIALLPNILIFTLPMSMLVGTATGFSRLGSDSELTAIRAAGIGTWRILSPVLGLGVLLSGITFYVGFELAPHAAQSLREIGMRAAMFRLESPVEPRSFNTEIPGKVIYIRDGDQEHGLWEGVFIYWQDKNKPVRLITSRQGRIDVSGEQSEL
ncbi:MAG: LptF/LptG family permease, partial [Acidobacteria bacterium]|nr:LptF/LptG family permease [Acidobacteriota bacterium]